MKAKLGEPVFIHETDPVKAEKAKREFWQLLIKYALEHASQNCEKNADETAHNNK